MSEHPQRFAGPELLPLREFIVTSAREEGRRFQRMAAVIAVLALGVLLGLLGWLNDAWVREEWRWFTTIRPYMVTQFQPYVLTAEAERNLKALQSFKECAKDCPEMVVMPVGEFVMGSPKNEKGRYDNEGPEHRVVLSYQFAVSKFELTFDEWDACISYGDCEPVSDNGFGRGQQPVIDVTWSGAKRYVAWLSRMTGRQYRLLSEAEWEYAARAGTQTVYSWGNDVGKGNANCNGCGSQWDYDRPAPVGSFAPNPFGLYDMHGNVLEWVLLIGWGEPGRVRALCSTVTIIDATSTTDLKTKSRWSRALRYAWQERKTWTNLRSFLRENGGPAGCADQFAAINSSGRYPGCIVYRRPGTGRPYLIVHKGA